MLLGRRACVTGCVAGPRLPELIFYGGCSGCGDAMWGYEKENGTRKMRERISRAAAAAAATAMDYPSSRYPKLTTTT